MFMLFLWQIRCSVVKKWLPIQVIIPNLLLSFISFSSAGKSENTISCTSGQKVHQIALYGIPPGENHLLRIPSVSDCQKWALEPSHGWEKKCLRAVIFNALLSSIKACWELFVNALATASSEGLQDTPLALFRQFFNAMSVKMVQWPWWVSWWN